MTNPTSNPLPPALRSLTQRREAALKLLQDNTNLWLATGSDGHGAHLIPVAYVWDGTRLTMATFAHSRTTANLRAYPHARVAIGPTDHLTMIDGDVSLVDPADMDSDIADRYARISFDPRTWPPTMPPLVYLRLVPTRVQAWNGFHEFTGRTVMAQGRWLDEPID
jgi:Pyridoxamine 5'-phosphate oxidase